MHGRGPGLPAQEGPYSAIKPPLPGSGARMTTPGGTFLDRMRNVLHQAAHPEPTSRCSPASSAWGDTPNSAELAQIAEIERAALREKLDRGIGPSMGVGNEQHPRGTAMPPRHLSFTPTSLPSITDTAKFPTSKRRSGSSGKRPRSGSGKRKISHLGRTAYAPHSSTMQDGSNLGQQRTLSTSLPIQTDNEQPIPGSEAFQQPRTALNQTQPIVSIDIPTDLQDNSKRLKTTNNGKIPSNLPQDYPISCSDTETETELGQNHNLQVAHDDALTQSDAMSPEGKSALLPAPGPLPPRNLTAYLPKEVCDIVAHVGGPHQLYPWQAECLGRPGILQVRRDRSIYKFLYNNVFLLPGDSFLLKGKRTVLSWRIPRFTFN